MAKVFDLTARYYVRTDLVTECVVFFCHLSASNQVLRIIIMGPFFSLSPFMRGPNSMATLFSRCSATADVHVDGDGSKFREEPCLLAPMQGQPAAS